VIVSPFIFFLLIFSFLLNYKKYFVLTIVFFLPFNDIFALTIHNTHLLFFHFLGLFFIFLEIFTLKIKLKINNQMRVGLFFILILYLSILSTLLNENKINIVPMHVSFLDYYTVPLHFSMTNFTQLLFPTFMFVLTYTLIKYINSLKIYYRILKVSILASILVFFSGVIIQCGLYFFGNNFISKFYWIFTGSYDVTDILSRIEYNKIGNFPRMYSLVGEPSFTSVYFITIIPIVFMFFKLTNNNKYLFITILLLFGVFLSGSTSGYIGFILLIFNSYILSLIFRNKRFSKNRTSIMKSLIIFLFIIIFIFLIYNNIDYIYNTHISKLVDNTGSMPVRLKTIMLSLEIFQNFPLFGVGYGSHRTTSLASSLLANTGIIGFGTFIIFISYIIFSLGKIMKLTTDYNFYLISKYIILSIISFIPLLLVFIPIVGISFGYTWLIIALGVSIIQIYKIKERQICSQKTH